MSTVNIDKFFQNEIFRLKCAKLKDKKSFISLYRKNSYDIPNRNTGDYWDIKNLEDQCLPRDNWIANDRHKIISNHIPKSSASVLNFGFGRGDLEKISGDKVRNNNWIGVDFSNKSVLHARKNYFGKYIRLQNFSFEMFTNKFDYIICSEVLEHISPVDTLKTIAKLNYLLKKGGTLIVSVPVNEGVSTLEKENLNSNAHVRDYSEKVLTYELEISGFTVIMVYRLCAFSNYYRLKSIINKLFSIRKPNNIIIIAQKN